MKIRKNFYAIVVIFLVILSIISFGENNEKSTLKRIVLTPDLNNDGKSDEIFVEFFEDESNVYTRFTPKIMGEKIGGYTDKIFEKEKFQEEFPKYTMEYISKYSKNTPKNEVEKEDNKNIIDEKNNAVYEYSQYYTRPRPENLTFNYLYKKNSPKDLDDFLFIRTTVNIRKEPKHNSKIIKKASYSQKYKVIGKVKVPSSKGITEWYEVVVNNETGYILANSKLVLKREFDWHDMMKKIEKLNKFIREELAKNKTIYVLDDYIPLGGGSGSLKDKFGNRENQSEKAYVDKGMNGEYINVPDRSLMTIVEETDKYIKVKIDAYNGIYYMKKNARRFLKNSGITEEITRFIYMDRKSQNEIVVEKNKGENNWNVVTTSFITTGKDAGESYATPFGAFLIAYSKPVMPYTGKDITKIIGDAKNAIRFSGGGYMHGIPSVFEPKETRETRKAITARKIGTYAESHKCVRHYDDQIKFIYNWLGNATPGHKYGYRKPIVPTVVLIK